MLVRRFFPLVLTALLGACGTPGAPREHWLPADAPLFVSAVDSMIAYHAYANALNAAEWTREKDRLRTPSEEDSDCLRRAMLAGAPAAPAADRSQATGLIIQCERELRKRGSTLAGLAGLLRAETLERQRGDERQREASRRADDLAAKLEELKAIEKSLLNRARDVQKPGKR